MALMYKWVDGVNGNDSNSGDTEDTAWKTLEKAVAGGTDWYTVFIKPGIYWLNSTPAVSQYGAHGYFMGTGQVVIRQPNAYFFNNNYGGDTNKKGLFWHNVAFMNTGTLIKGDSPYSLAGLNNCMVATSGLVMPLADTVPCYAVNVTTPSGITMTTPASGSTANVFYQSGTASGRDAVVTTYRCLSGSGTYVGGAFLNPSGSFPSLFGAYPLLPKRIASAGLMKIYPPNAGVATVLSTTGSGCYAASPMQPSIVAADPTEAWNTRNKEFTASTTTNVRYNIDYGSAIVGEGVYIVNGAGNGSATANGAKNFILQGSNSATAFADTTYATDTNWTTLGSGTFNQRSSLTARTAQIVPITNSTAYRYYSIKLVDNYGGATNILVTKLLVAAKNTLSQCDMDVYKTGDTGSQYFPASSTGWVNDDTYTSGAAQINDYGIALNSGTSARVVSPVMEFFGNITLRNIAYSGTEAPIPSGHIIEYRASAGAFMPSATSPTWTTYTANSDVAVSGTYLQYRFTIFVG